MFKSFGSRSVVLALLAACLSAARPGVAEERPGELRAKWVPLYLQVRQDQKLQAMDRALAGRMDDKAAVDKLLAAMPLSPLEYLQVDMQRRRYEIVVPQFIHELHVRWIELREKEARELYGDTYVDRTLTRWPVDTGAVAPGDPSRVAIGTNRNSAATFAPAPLDYDGEVQISVNPRNFNQIVSAANTYDSCGGTVDTQGIFYSSDGGATWGYTCAPDDAGFALGSCGGRKFASDPALSWNDQNEVFLNYLMVCGSPLDFRFALVTSRSSDGGATWTPQGVTKNSWATPNQFEDKNFYSIDTTPTSPFYGRHYNCWDRDNDQKIAYSTNNGVSWTEVDLPAAPVGGADLACEMAISKSGTVHLVWNSLTCGVDTCSDERMFYTRSTNGGVSWSTPVQVRDFNLVGFSNENFPPAADSRGISPFGAIDIDNSNGPCRGNLYATFSDWTAGGVTENDVWVSRSTNFGLSWSPAVKVNDDGLAGRTQFHPFLQVDPSNGNVVVAWHDTRNDPGNKKVDYYVARSTNCGSSFEPNIKASQNSFEFNNSGISSTDLNSTDNPNRNTNQYGEYMGLDAKGGKAYLAWTDSRHFFPGSSTDVQRENVGFALINFSGTTTTFVSAGAEDGWVRELAEAANVGGASDATSSSVSAIRVGDGELDRQFKGVVSFDTAPIPNDATILSVTLRLRRGTVAGTNPFDTHGALSVDVSNAFGGATALASGDFQAAASATAVCTLSNAAVNLDTSECTWNAAGLAAINKAGRTQLRLAFALDDNDDGETDYIGYLSGENATEANRPQLIVAYQ